MTNKETMEKLKYSIEPNQGFIELRKQIEEAIKVAIEALEKQIPEIPDYEGDGYADGELVYDTWICPRCGRHYEIDYDHYVYCPECGQLISWDSLEQRQPPKNVPFNPPNQSLSDFYAKVVQLINHT